MKINTLAAPLAMAAVLGLGSAAFAQNMVGTQQITEADRAAVAEHCRTLAMGSDDKAPGATASGGDAGNSGNADDDAAAGTGPTPDAGTMDGAMPTTGNEGNQDDDAPDPTAVSPAAGPASGTTGLEGNADADQFSGSINMEVITLADCKAAGL